MEGVRDREKGEQQGRRKEEGRKIRKGETM
jgi:hypothetical protein